MYETIDAEGVPPSLEEIRLAHQRDYVQQLSGLLRRARGALVNLPPNLREQVRIDALSVADAAAELQRLGKPA